MNKIATRFRRQYGAAAWLLLPAVWLPIAEAQSPSGRDFRSALIGTGRNSLLTILTCPILPLPQKPVTVVCKTHVLFTGRADNIDTSCYGTQPATDQFQKAAENAAQRATYVPATIDGRRTPVFMPFRVVFSNAAGQCKITTIPNLGGELSPNEINFIAPQEILKREPWYLRGGSLSSGSGIERRLQSCQVLFNISVAVSATGVASEARIAPNNWASEAEMREARIAIEYSDFIPGFYQGKPTGMRYKDFVYGCP